MSKSQEYIKYLFSDVLVFEKEVLHVNCDPDRQEIMALMSKEICSDSKLSSKLNFLKIKSIDDLDFSAVKIALVQLILEELLLFLQEKNYSRVEIETIKKDKDNLKFIYELAKSYMRRFGTVFYKEVAHTFFDLISVASKPEEMSKVVSEVVSGNDRHKSLLEQSSGGQVVYKPEQAWMRVKQARDDKNRKVQRYQVDIMNIVKRIDYLKLQISAIVAARSLTLNEVKNVTPKLMLDMFTNDEDVQLHTKKTMFSYVGSGELANTLVRVANIAQNNASNRQEEIDYKKIGEFFTKCMKNNTKSFLDARFEDYKNELEIKNERYRQERIKLKTLRERPLDSFDQTLKHIKEALIYNLQRI